MAIPTTPAVSAGHAVWVKVRTCDAERTEWHAKARSAGLTLSGLVHRSIGRVRTWTVAHAEVERERTRELARLGNNLNQIARWANIHKEAIEAVEVIAHLVAIGRPLSALDPTDSPDADERQTEENATLRRRIERLDEQVTRLTGYCGTSAAVRPRGRGW